MRDGTRWNLPNALSAARLLGVPLLFVLVHRAPVEWFATCYGLLGLTDWLDGKLARAWGQTSAFGAMLDSVADVAYYVSTAYFAFALFPDAVRPNLPFVAGAVALLVTLVVVSRVRVGKVLLPHTHLSRAAGAGVVLVVFASFATDTTRWFTAVIGLYALAFLEQILMVSVYGDIPLDTRTILWLTRRTRASS
jgi:cardiolipin synthase